MWSKLELIQLFEGIGSYKYGLMYKVNPRLTQKFLRYQQLRQEVCTITHKCALGDCIRKVWFVYT